MLRAYHDDTIQVDFVKTINSITKQENMIIHFTKNFDSLKKIIQTLSFNLSYCKEFFNVEDERISSAAHPMVCFSEYDLDVLEKQYITYGKYGIGFTKKWAIENRLNPVLYIEKNSQAAKGLGNLLKARQGKFKSVSLPNDLRLPIMQLKCFAKNVKGYNSSLKKDDYDFTKENEWRYIPYKKDINGNYISIDLSKYEENQSMHNEKIEDYPLKFEIIDDYTAKSRSRSKAIT